MYQRVPVLHVQLHITQLHQVQQHLLQPLQQRAHPQVLPFTPPNTQAQRSHYLPVLVFHVQHPIIQQPHTQLLLAQSPQVLVCRAQLHTTLLQAARLQRSLFLLGLVCCALLLIIQRQVILFQPVQYPLEVVCHVPHLTFQLHHGQVQVQAQA